jgi:flagellar basal-body rod protein FlgB
MAISDIPIFAMLRTRMKWNQINPQGMAQNIANSDTPNFRPQDLDEPKFELSAPGTAPLQLARTDTGHLQGFGDAASFRGNNNQYQVRPAGNAVNLEDEMLKIAQNNMDYQAATQLYSRGLNLIKSAIGSKG